MFQLTIGKSELKQTAITIGQSVLVTGTVLDQSPAQPGTPAVSKESMSTWMDYLHMQMPIAGYYKNVTVTGVPVSIDAVDPNGNNVHIADISSDMSGTFGYTWTPSIAGQYKITATFMGDDSYSSSWAQTYAAVVNAPATTPTPVVTPTPTPVATPTPTPTATASPSPAPNPDTGPSTDMYIIAAAAIIIIVVAAVAALVLRKRK